MKIIEQSHQIIHSSADMLKLIESAGRTCYKSENKITDHSSIDFAAMILSNKHESVLEHASVTVRFITNRGVTHELVRHRLCAYSQESTRYVKYDDVEYIKPVWWDEWTEKQRSIWMEAMQIAQDKYKTLIESGAEPQQAREVLPNSLKTEIVMTANIREWRHVFKARCSTHAHPQIRSLMKACLKDFQEQFPILFDGIDEKTE